MNHSFYSDTILAFLIGLIGLSSFSLQAAVCSFDRTKTCTLQRDILNDLSVSGAHFYGATNYDHRLSGELNVYDATLVMPYKDEVNAPGQVQLKLNKIRAGFYKSGEIMTRMNLDEPPYSSPSLSFPWTTKEITHGYLEVKVKMPKCDTSDDGLCQRNINPASYNDGLWPAIWMMPSMDLNWPVNGEIDIADAYQFNSSFNQSSAFLHFYGNDKSCEYSDCVGGGYLLGTMTTTPYPLYNAFHTWGFEWYPDTHSQNGGVVMNGYFDGIKIWGPTATDLLPAEAPAAFARGFNDTNGGFYLIVNLAIGGPYTGSPNPHLSSASMYIQSIKAYNVKDVGPIPATCLPPVNIQSIVSGDKKQVVIVWQPPENSAPIQFYQATDYQNVLLWKGNNEKDRSFIDDTLPGTPGIFTYKLYTICTSEISAGVTYNVVVR